MLVCDRHVYEIIQQLADDQGSEYTSAVAFLIYTWQHLEEKEWECDCLFIDLN